MNAGRHRGFTIPECLVVLGVLLILMSLLIPSLASTRNRGRQVTSLSNVRQLGSLVSAYAAGYRDFPPVLFRPQLAFLPNGPWQFIEVDGETVRGSWWENPLHFHVAMDRDDVAPVALDPSRPSRLRSPYSRTGSFDYAIARTFYATPEFWNRWTQVGVSQFVPQRLSSVLFPSQKGFLHQFVVFSVSMFPDGYGACCDHPEPSAILWADSSATFQARTDLIRGEPNFYHFGSPSPPPYWSDGPPIDGTKHGTRGRDR
jgi:prepilin-type N-terminal cleavage/methylation domain-containing protein